MEVMRICVKTGVKLSSTFGVMLLEATLNQQVQYGKFEGMMETLCWGSPVVRGADLGW